MDFRIAGRKDREAFKRLWSYAFNGDEPFYSWYFTDYYNPLNALGGWQDGELRSCLHLHPYDLFLRGSVMPASYIVGVAADPAARQGGGSRYLLAAALREMRQRGHYVSILMPSKAGFYYPFDWRLCYHHLKYVLPLDDLKPGAKPGSFYPAAAKDIAALDAAYRRFVDGKHGYVVRAEQNWLHLLGEHANDQGYTYCLEIDNQPAGYIMYMFRGDRILVKEMVYIDQAARQALFGFLYSHRSQAKTVEWNAPLDMADGTLFTLFDPKQDIRVFPFMAGRVVDVAQALAAARYPAGKYQLKLKIEDGLAPWNNQTFNLSISDRQAVIEAAGPAESEASCSVGALSQLFFGRLGAADLERQGKLQTSTPRVLDLLDKLFPLCDNFINEYF